jgi:recombination protein RecR
MLTLPSALQDLIHRLARMPGTGPRSAERIALGMLRWDSAEIAALSEALVTATGRVTSCPNCGVLSQDEALCTVCADPLRDGTLLCVVEGPLDAIAIERGGGFGGRYHVLGGALSPMRGVLPADLRIKELIERLPREGVREVIVATNGSPDGEATALYLKEELAGAEVRMTRLARGLPSGGHLDYADAATVQSALENRTEL